MATLREFLATGHLGPLVLGMTTEDVLVALGDPQDVSRKTKPLRIRYGPVELSFWKTPEHQTYQLREISVTYGAKPKSAPKALSFKDWQPKGASTATHFKSFLEDVQLLPIQSIAGPAGEELIFPSGVTVLFSDSVLHTIRLLQRKNKEATPTVLSHEREPTKEQILGMLEDADRLKDLGAHQAALLLAWAGLEATLRRALLQTGYKGKITLQPSILIRELVSARQLDFPEQRHVERLRQLRSAAAHGLMPSDFDVDEVTNATNLARQLLNTEGIPAPAKDRDV